MQLNMKWAAVLNPGQILADASNQLLCTLTNELQFRHVEIFSQYFTIFRQLHSEHSLLLIHGQQIEGSGLAQVLTKNKFSMIVSSAFVDVNNIKRTRYSIEITLCAPFIKLY